MIKLNFKRNNSERIGKIKHTIKILSELMDKGVEIHPALNQPESVKNLFPDMNNLKKWVSQTKKLKE